MIGYIKGIVEEIGANYIIIENSGMGYLLSVSSNTIQNLELGKEAKIYTKMIVREDDISLCGFYSKDEEEMFNLLTSVSKIGPKVGMGILSFANSGEIAGYILSGDTTKLSKAPGVGKKTAERIVLELKDKVEKLGISIDIPQAPKMDSSNKDEISEAIEALVNLGYSNSEASDAVSFVNQPKMGVEDIIKKALEYIMKTSMKF